LRSPIVPQPVEEEPEIAPSAPEEPAPTPQAAPEEKAAPQTPEDVVNELIQGLF